VNPSIVTKSGSLFSAALFSLSLLIFSMPDDSVLAQEKVFISPVVKSSAPTVRLEKLTPSKKLSIIKRFSLRINVDEIEPNNGQETAQALSGSSPIVVNGSAETSDIGELSINYQDGTRDDVEDLYKLTISQPGLKINLSGNQSDLDIFLFDSPVTGIIKGSNGTGVGGEEIDQPALAAGTYVIGVTIYDPSPIGPTTSPYVLTLTFGFGSTQPPANDECATATVVSQLPFQDEVDTRTATVQANDPPLPCADGGGGKTVWYKFTPGQTMAVNVSTVGSTPEDYDTALGVFTGSCADLSLIVCNDDLILGVVRQADTSFVAQAGQTYYILVAEWNGGGPSGGVPTGGDLVFSMREETLFQGPAAGSIASGASRSTDDITGASGLPKIASTLHKHQALDDREIELIDNTGGAANLAHHPQRNFFQDPAIENEAESMALPKTVTQPTAPFPVLSFSGLEDTGFIPPDPIVAAGPNHIVACVNSAFGIFDKTGALIKYVDASEWYENVLPGALPCDPQIVFDTHSNRWFMVWIECGTRATSVLLSVSDDDNPLGIWCNWRLPGDVNGSTTSGLGNDFPKLGIDQNALYITNNMNSFAFEYVQLRIIPKQQLLGNTCGPVTWTDFWDLRDPDNLAVNVHTVVPALTFGTPGTEYMINDSPYEIGAFATLWSVTNPTSANPSLSAVNVPVDTSFGVQTDAQQLGGGEPLIDTSDRKFRNAVYRDGSLWTAHSVPGGTDNAFALARYLRINTATATAIEDVAFGADNFWYFYPAVMVDQNSNLTMVVNRSGHTEYAGIRYTGRLNSALPGLQASAQLKAGESNYLKTFSGSRNRWGDYNGIALDPSDPNRIWMFAEYAETPVGPDELDQRWGTWFGQTTFAPLTGRQAGVDPVEIYFGEVGFNSIGPSLPISIRSIGDQALTVSSVTSSTANFVLENLPALPAVIAPGGVVEFFVRFAPSLITPESGSITVTTNDPETPVIQISLSGKIGEDIDLSTPGLAATLLSGEYTELSFSIDNLGPEELSYRISASGLGAYNLPSVNSARVDQGEGLRLSSSSLSPRVGVDGNQKNEAIAFRNDTPRSISPDRAILAHTKTLDIPTATSPASSESVLLAGGARSLFNYDVGTAAGEILAIGVEFDGQHFWVTGAGATRSSDPNRLFKFDIRGDLAATYDQPTVDVEIGWTDLAFDGGFLYAGNGNHIDQIDPATGKATGVTIPSPHAFTVALAYDPASDHFWTASFNSLLYEIDRNGNTINLYPNTLDIFGLAWDAATPGGPYLWAWSQDGDGVLATRFSPQTGSFSSVGFAGDELLGGFAGGATFTTGLPTSPNGLGVLVVLHQAEPSDLIAVYAPPPSWVAEVAPNSRVLGPLESTQVKLKIDADNIAAGAYDAELIVGSSDDDEGRLPMSLSLTVNAAQGSQIRLDPAGNHFGRISLGEESAPAAISIRSIGAETLSITNITSSNPAFALEIPGLPLAIPSGGKVNFTAKYSPQAAGPDTGDVIITSNDADEPVKKILLSGYGVPVGAAEPGVLYAVSGPIDGGRFFTIDQTTGRATVAGITGFSALSAVAINSVGEVYATTPENPSTLLKINATTSVATTIGEMNVGFVNALAFNGNDVLYGVSRSENSALYTIDVSSAAATSIGSTGVNCISGISFSPEDVLYAATGKECNGAAGDELYTIDAATAAATLVGAVGFFGSIPDIAFDLDGNLFGLIGADASKPNSFISINPATGAGTRVGPLGFESLSGLSFFRSKLTAVDDADEAAVRPKAFALDQNFPNPFNPSTRIRYAISGAGRVTLKIYSLLGQLVRTLVDQEQNADFHEAVWDGRNDSGVVMPTGIYFYQIRAGNEIATRRMLFLK
jgi:hypothetical protein